MLEGGSRFGSMLALPASQGLDGVAFGWLSFNGVTFVWIDVVLTGVAASWLGDGGKGVAAQIGIGLGARRPLSLFPTFLSGLEFKCGEGGAICSGFWQRSHVVVRLCRRWRARREQKLVDAGSGVSTFWECNLKSGVVLFRSDYPIYTCGVIRPLGRCSWWVELFSQPLGAVTDVVFSVQPVLVYLWTIALRATATVPHI